MSLARLYENRSVGPADVMRVVLGRIQGYPDPAVWIHRQPADAILAEARQVEQRRAAGEALPLYGIPFGVKDNIDMAGCPTTAACPAFAHVPNRSAPIVDRLRAAGAVFIGKTNLDQFACGLAGDRSPFGACRNVFDPRYVSGGSSSGSAVAVAAGLVTFALGTDTAGSGRVPAGCNNIVGLKPTLGLLSTEGVIPSCRSLDCVTVMALTADDARWVCDVALEGRWPDPPPPVQPDCEFVFAVPRDEDLEFSGDREQARLYQQGLARLERLGGRRVRIDFRPFREAAELLYGGPWLAERYAGLADFFRQHWGDLHPVTREILQGALRYSGVDVFAGSYHLQALRETCGKTFGGADFLAVPTMPTLPTLEAVHADSVGWSRRLGYYTNFANLLRLAAITLPNGFTSGGLPGSITLIGPGGSDLRLCELGAAWQRQVSLPLGATGHRLPEIGAADQPTPRVPAGHVRVAVAGAHLRGQPLHGALRRFGARFVRACRTGPYYRFFAFLHLDPPRPALLREVQDGSAIAVEVYDLPVAGFGALVASVAPPLTIGTVDLEDGEAVKGFLCESVAALKARDISEFGGWAAFRQRADGSGTRNHATAPR